MADGDRQNSYPRGERGPREGGNRDAGGFRIRLSDNEMRAARAVQEAFGLRSTVAALGLSIRTVAQLLEDGKLDEQVAQHRATSGSRPGGERRGPRPERGERPAASSRPNPFARPARPAAPEPAAEQAPEAADQPVSDETPDGAVTEASPEPSSEPSVEA